MSSFIEWRSESGLKQPYVISNEDEAIAAAALWEVWNRGEQPLLSCTVVTTAAAPQFSPWHSRMPVMLAPDEYDRWLDNSRPIDADDVLFRSELKTPLRLHPVDRAIGNARQKSVTLLQSIGDVVVLEP